MIIDVANCNKLLNREISLITVLTLLDFFCAINGKCRFEVNDNAELDKTCELDREVDNDMFDVLSFML